MELSSRNNLQKQFLGGTLPNPLPDGPYQGSVPSYTVSWQGKKFDAANHSGINLFKAENGKLNEKYSFKTYTGTGLKDKTVSVFKIDYDIPGNPFWLRWILDEIVEVAPGVYLGKMIVRLFGISFVPTFFTLKK